MYLSTRSNQTSLSYAIFTLPRLQIHRLNNLPDLFTFANLNKFKIFGIRGYSLKILKEYEAYYRLLIKKLEH